MCVHILVLVVVGGKFDAIKLTVLGNELACSGRAYATVTIGVYTRKSFSNKATIFVKKLWPH